MGRQRMEKARDISASGYVFTQEDFKRIKARQNEKLLKLDSKNRKRKMEEDDEDDDSDDDEDDDDADPDRDGPLLKIGAIEGVHAKRKKDKQAKIEAIKKGREGREKFGGRKEKMNPYASENTRQKQKHQPFMMVKQKMREKQAKLKKSMMRREKNSH